MRWLQSLQIWPELHVGYNCKCGCEAVKDGPEPVKGTQEAEQDA